MYLQAEGKCWLCDKTGHNVFKGNVKYALYLTTCIVIMVLYNISKSQSGRRLTHVFLSFVAGNMLSAEYVKDMNTNNMTV